MEEALNIHLVFSHPPSGVSDAEFTEWYEKHLPEILRIPGFVAAQLYRLAPFIPDANGPLPYTHMTAYEFRGTAEDAMAGIVAERKSGGMDLPDWFDRFEGERCLISWNCIALGPKVTAEAGS